MRPAEVSPEEIITAGQALQAAGRNITGFALRQRLNGGNANRLMQIWTEHMASLATASAVPVAELPVEVADELAAVSGELTARIGGLVARLNDKAVRAAERRVAELVRAAGEQRAQAERELADAAQTVDDLEARLDAAQADIARLQPALAAAQADNQVQAVTLAQLHERVGAADKAAKSTAEQHAAALAQLNSEHHTERTRHAQEVEQLRAEIERQRTEIANVKAKAASAEDIHRAFRRTAELEASRSADRIKQIEAEREAALNERGDARQEAARLLGQIEQLQAQNSQLMEKLSGT